MVLQSQVKIIHFQTVLIVKANLPVLYFVLSCMSPEVKRCKVYSMESNQFRVGKQTFTISGINY